MNKKMRELLTKIETKRNMAKDYMDGENKDIEKAQEVLNEIDVLKKEYEIEKRLYSDEKEENTPTELELEKTKKIKDEKDIVKNFANNVRKVASNMNETTNTDGGYTVPEEISTKVEELRTAVASLADFVRVYNVKTDKGAKTYKTRTQARGFTKVGEKGKITQSGKPSYSRIEYEIEKYAGYLPVTNELLEDSDQDIYNDIVTWLADESRATRNNLILGVINTKTAVELTGLDSIKKVLNVTLGQAFKATSNIFTNDDGLQYLDTLKDKNGRDLLQPDPTNTAVLRLRAGATTIPIVVIPNEILKTAENKVPFIIGDLYEGVALFDRKKLNILASNVATVEGFNAFEEDMTLLRGIEREDVEVRDVEAFVNGYITVSEAPSV